MNLHRSKEWRLFREEVIRLDGGGCTRCRRSISDGAMLHVHHKFYLPDRKPWQYPYEACETLCRSCHAQEHGIIPPKDGWALVEDYDLGDPSGSCEYCGTEIRYVFVIQHNKWPTLEVGEICCDNLTGTVTASEYMRTIRRYRERRKRFASSCRWTMDQHGVATVRQDGIDVAIVPVDTRSFRLKMNGMLGRLMFTSVLEAKMKAFEVIHSGKAARYLRKVQINKPIAEALND